MAKRQYFDTITKALKALWRAYRDIYTELDEQERQWITQPGPAGDLEHDLEYLKRGTYNESHVSDPEQLLYSYGIRKLVKGGFSMDPEFPRRWIDWGREYLEERDAETAKELDLQHYVGTELTPAQQEEFRQNRPREEDR